MTSKQSVDYPKSPMPPQHQQRPGMETEMYPPPLYRGITYRPAGKLEGKVALITGGDSGIGRSVAVLFAREGADAAIIYLPPEQADAEETKKAIEGEGRRCLLLPGDVCDPEFCEHAVRHTMEQFGKLNILVNNAAYQHHQRGLQELSDDQLDITLRVNVHGYFNMARAALARLKSGDVIINCGSITGMEGNKQLLDYAASKGAIHAFTKSLAQNLIERGIRVNCVAPGPVWTPLNVADRPPDQVAQHGAGTSMHRPAQPEEISPAFVFFASNADSGYITGEVLSILGGHAVAA
jgi:NAD(P)-dependent dehydrogenase (short-subunit alcohol dehydrogenase family)